MATKPKEVETEAKPTEAENQGKSTETENQGIEGVIFDDGEDEVQLETETPKEKETETPPEKLEAEAVGKEPEKKEEEADPVQKKFDKLTFKRREAEEKAQTAEEKLAAAQAEIERLKGQSGEVKVPELPDPLDPEYNTKLAAWKEATLKQAEIDAQKKIAAQAEVDAVEEKRKQVLDNIKTNHEKMYSSADKFGFKKEDFEAADIKVGQFLRPVPEVAHFILEQDDAPLIVQYLAANVETMDKLSRMSPVHATAFLVSEVMTKAQELRPKPTNTPEPLDLVKGKGGGEKESPYLEGVQME